jgi:hypothetical protein
LEDDPKSRAQAAVNHYLGPADIWCQVLAFLDVTALARLQPTCKLLHQSQAAWANLYISNPSAISLALNKLCPHLMNNLHLNLSCGNFVRIWIMLESFVHLETVHFDLVNLVNAGFTLSIKQLPSVRNLTLKNFCNPTSGHAGPHYFETILRSCPRTEKLTLQLNAEWTETWASCVSQACPALLELSLLLWNDRVDFKPLKLCRFLETVNLTSFLQSSIISFDGLQQIKNLFLDTINLRDTSILPPLQRLELTRVYCSDLSPGWSSSSELRETLQELRLLKSPLNDSRLMELRDFTRLRSVEVSLETAAALHALLAIRTLLDLHVSGRNDFIMKLAALCDHETFTMLAQHPTLRLCSFRRFYVDANVLQDLERVRSADGRLEFFECTFAEIKF